MLKTVCHISSAHPRHDVRIVERECVSLVEAGYNVYFIVNDNNESEIYKGVHIRSTGYMPKTRIGRVLFGVRKVLQEAQKIDADIYHIHDPELLLIARKLKKRGKRVLFDSHEYYYEQIKTKKYIPTKMRNLVADVYYKYETSVTNKIDGVIIPCKIEGKNVFEGRTPRTIFINNVPRLRDISSISICSKLKDTICYSGSISYERGIWHLVQATVEAKATLMIAGDFSSEAFKDILFSNEKQKYIQYKGKLDIAEIYNMYDSCQIGMCTLLDAGQYSKIENFPTKVYEYMATGLPVILSDFPYNRKMIEEYQFGMVVKPDDVQDISQKIRYLLDNQELALAMGQRGKQLVLQKFNWAIEEKKLLNLYNELSENVI